MLHYKAVDLHEVSSARRGDLAEEAGVGVAHWSRSGRLSWVRVCSQQEEGETMLSGESIQSISQSNRRDLRQH